MSNMVTLRKSGGFYMCFDNDAIILSYLFGYKIVNGRVGFPISALNKVLNGLENNFISFINLDDGNKISFGKKNSYRYYLDKGKKKIDIDYRINSIMEKIGSWDEEKLLGFIDMIEEKVNE